MKTLTLRGIDDDLDQKIREKSKLNGESINKTALKLIKSALGLQGSKPFPVYHDLDALAGTWTKEEAEEFKDAVKELDEIEKDMW